ncbi:MAG: NADH-quinone oxidoreductase subunit NuoE [Verrucomicrobia bacterium]|nr:NADH-quinone oxidoreductase subunit NuoE [Verrucomicrobiota bacterium]
MSQSRTWTSPCRSRKSPTSRDNASPVETEGSHVTATALDIILQKHPGAGRDALIPILQEVQESQGYLSRDVVTRIGRHLRLPTSKIYGVATFYNQFRFQPKGRYHFTVCRGTACHVKGSLKVLDMLRKHLKLEPGETSRDGLFSLEVVACMGACGLAPVVNVNGEFHAKVTPKKIAKIIEECREGELTHAEA